MLRQASGVLRRAVARRQASTLVLADHDGATMTPSTLAALTAAGKLNPTSVVLVAGAPLAVAEQAARAAGVAAVFHVAKAPSAKGIAAFVTEGGYSHVFAPVSNNTKDFVPRVAAALGVSPVTDVCEVISEDTFVRPFYAGNALATVKTQQAVTVATVRATAFEKVAAEGGLVSVEPAAIAEAVAPELAEHVSASSGDSTRPDLTAARVVVSGGRGMKSGENFAMLEKLADKLGGAVGASRAAVDAGMVPNELQVGQTGKVVAPELYIAVGISGAIQHLSGMKDSKTIVAINKDKEAPVRGRCPSSSPARGDGVFGTAQTPSDGVGVATHHSPYSRADISSGGLWLGCGPLRRRS